MDALHPSSDKIPNSVQLANLIAKEFLDDSFIGFPLSSVSQYAISQTDLFRVQRFIYDIIEPFQPAAFHEMISTFKWRSIYTTNYDFIIERAYEKNSNRLQELNPIIRNTRYQNIYPNENALPYYKLHGSLSNINDQSLPLILTPDQYITHQLNRDRLFSKLLEESHSFSFIFVGYGFMDHDINAILNKVNQEKDGRPRSYMVGPGIRPAEESFWEGKKISSFKVSFQEFMTELNSKISPASRVLSKVRPTFDNPIYNQFVQDPKVKKPSPSFLNFIENDIEYIHSSISSSTIDAKEFYKGVFKNWDPIIRNLDVKREVTEDILSEVFLEDHYSNDNDGQVLILIKGSAGSGKSVALKRLAWDAAVSFEKLCIFYKENATIKYDNINELFSFCRRRIFLFVDNLLKTEDEIKELLVKCKRDKIPITIVGTERVSTWNNENNQIKNFLDLQYNLEYLSNNEIKELITILTKHNSLGFLEGKTHKEQFDLLGPRAGRVLLVALYEATHGKPFREIINDEYNKIQNDTAKSLYLTVSILHMLGVGARAGLISRVHGISFERFKRDFFSPLERIVSEKYDPKIADYVYFTRHPYIAQMIFETVLTDEGSRYDEFIRIISYLDVDYDSDRSAFIYLTNAKRLIELFPNKKLIYNIFDKAEESSENNPKLYQQRAILELETNNLKAAERNIAIANDLSQSNDSIILHTLAELEFKKAELSNIYVEKNTYLDKAIQHCESQIKKFGPSTFSYHTIIKSLNQKLELAFKHSDAPTIERLIKEIEKKIRTASQLFPMQQFIIEAEAKFNQIVKNIPEALELLRRAHDINKASPFIASRLANVLEVNDNLPEALKVLQQTLEHNSGDKDINYSYAMLLQKLKPTDFTNIIFHLKKSFTEGDNRYQAQFWCARAYYLNNNIEEARRLFKALSIVNMDPKIKSKAIGISTHNDVPTVCRGKTKLVESSYGFIVREMYGDDIFASKFENSSIWGKLRQGQQVEFNLAFSYKGPVALNIKSKTELVR